MAGVGRQLDRRAHLIAEQMNGIEILRQADEVAVIPEVSGPAAALAIMYVGRSRHQPEVDAVAAHQDAPRGIAGLESEGGGRGGQRFLHQASIEAYGAGEGVDFGTGRSKDSARSLGHDLHAELFEDAERGEMHRLELIRGEDLHGRVRTDDLRPGQLRYGGSVSAPAPASLTAAICIDTLLLMHRG